MRNIVLSKRLQKVADFMSPSCVICDVGCDHGYMSIYLIQKKLANKVLAMDINKGPLERARENINNLNLEGQIETRLSNGLLALNLGEANSFLCAGMGGRLMIQIMKQSLEIIRLMDYFVLQPQSEINLVRKFIYEMGFYIIDEDMVYEPDAKKENRGQYYPIMKVGVGERKMPSEIELLYGPVLIRNKNLVLKQYIEYNRKNTQKILEQMKLNINSDKSINRENELKSMLAKMDEVRKIF